MRFIFTLFALLTLAAAPALAQNANPAYPGMYLKPLGEVLASTAIDSSQCVTLTQAQMEGGSLLVLHIDGTFANNGNVTMTAFTIPATNTTEYTIQDLETASGVGTSSNASWVKAVTAAGDENWPWRVDVAGFYRVKLCFIHSAGGANDKITVVGHVSTKG